MTIADVLAACRMIKTAGTSSKVPLPIHVIESICQDALAWQRVPAPLKELVKGEE